MNISRHDHDDITVLVLEGRLDNNTVPMLETTFSDLTASGVKKFVWDLEKLDYMSSAGLRVVLRALKHVGANGGGLVIASPSKFVGEVFHVAGFHSFLTISNDRTSGVEKLKA